MADHGQNVSGKVHVAGLHIELDAEVFINLEHSLTSWRRDDCDRHGRWRRWNIGDRRGSGSDRSNADGRRRVALKNGLESAGGVFADLGDVSADAGDVDVELNGRLHGKERGLV